MAIYDRFMDVLIPALRDIAFFFGPFALIPLLGLAVWLLWQRYIKTHNIFNSEWSLLEIVLPKETYKSPKSMEVVFSSMNQTYAGNWWTRFTQGTIRTWFSLEIVSLEGKVHFYVRTLRLFKNTVEVAIYGEFPNAEVVEVDDYFKALKYGKGSDLEVYALEVGLVKEDPYPIRTYVDYGLDKESVKEEFKTDPITPIIEFFSSLGPKQYAMVQILVQAAKKRYTTKKGKEGDWKDEGKDLVEKLMEEKTGSKQKKDGTADFGIFKLTPADTEILKAIDRSTSKIGFDCGIRLLYAAEKGFFRLEQRLAFKSLFTAFNTQNLNGFKMARETAFDAVFRGWLGINDWKAARLKKEMFNAYRLRSYFYPPYAETPFVLNTEELATVFHFPGTVSSTAGLSRIDSKRGEAPPDLPI